MADELPSTAAQINRDLHKMLKQEDSLDVAGINGHHYLALALPQGKRLTFKCADSEGRRTRTGDFFGAYNNGARLVVEGSVGRFAADSMVAGEVIVNGNAGKGLAHNLQGGTVVVRGDAGENTGLPMTDGTVIVDGNVGANAFARLTGGRVVVTGEAGLGLGKGMTGGTIYVAGSLPELGPELLLGRPGPAVRQRIFKLLTRYGIETEGLSLHQITPAKGRRRSSKVSPETEAEAQPGDSEDDEEELMEAELEQDDEQVMEAQPEEHDEGPVHDAEPPEDEDEEPVEAQLEAPPADPLAAAVAATLAETEAAKQKELTKQKEAAKPEVAGKRKEAARLPETARPTGRQDEPGQEAASPGGPSEKERSRSKLQTLKAEAREARR